MEKNHLTYFKVENFKKFDVLEVNDIGQFNLIVGDNNVGKTCLLEALLFDEDEQQLLNNFYLGLTKRGLKFQIEEITSKVKGVSKSETVYPKLNYFENVFFENLKTKSSIVFFYKNIKSLDQKKVSVFQIRPDADYEIIKSHIQFEYNKENELIPLNDLMNQFIHIVINRKIDKVTWIYDYDTEILNFPLVSFNDTPLEEETINIYETLRTKQEKEILLNALKVINNKIVGIDFRGKFNDLESVFLISYDDKDDFYPLNYMGDGFKRIFYIILKMLSLTGKRILIDEIEIGIHHTKIKDFWVNIFKVAKELDVQVFATTHSDECIEAFVEASNEINHDDIRLIQLQADVVDNKTYASTFKYKNIKAGINSNLKMLG